MLKRLFIAASLFAASLFTTAPASASDLQTIASATFKLYDGHAPADGMCSVTFIGNDERGALFLTAAHCVEGGEDYNVRRLKLDQKDLMTPLSAEVYYVKAVRTLKSKDIALLQVRDKDVNFYETVPDVATVEEANTLRIGDELRVVGYPAAEVLTITSGEFAGKRSNVFAPAGLDKNTPIYQTTVGVAGGNSGGGLYAKFDGEWKLIGTTTGKRRDNEVMTFFQTSETVHEVLTGFYPTHETVATPVSTKPASNIGLDAYKRNGSGRLDEK